MSKPKEKPDSDDEFQDALSDPTVLPQTDSTATADEDVANEVKQKLSLNDNESAESDPVIPKEAMEDGEGEGAVGGEEEPEDDFNEDDMREFEKTLTEEELLQHKESADKLKLQGNELFKNEEAEKAVEMYTEALRICPTTYTKERAVLYGNRAAAKIKLDSRKSAIQDCTKALALWPEYMRALIRRAKLYELEEKLDEALEDYKRIYDLDPGQREARDAIVRLPPMIQERNERMKEEMMSKLKDLGNMILKPFGLSTNNFQMQQDPNTGSYSFNFNQN